MNANAENKKRRKRKSKKNTVHGTLQKNKTKQVLELHLKAVDRQTETLSNVFFFCKSP